MEHIIEHYEWDKGLLFCIIVYSNSLSITLKRLYFQHSFYGPTGCKSYDSWSIGKIFYNASSHLGFTHVYLKKKKKKKKTKTKQNEKVSHLSLVLNDIMSVIIKFSKYEICQ